jgi:hypothetical protein
MSGEAAGRQRTYTVQDGIATVNIDMIKDTVNNPF